MELLGAAFYGILWVVAPFVASGTYATTGNGNWIIFSENYPLAGVGHWFMGGLAAVAWWLVVLGVFAMFVVITKELGKRRKS